ncbi:MAG: c-type cytochrome [Steroidobacteraceae bacterium]|jgi:cytochrome c553|nr:c-type cytochrome [Steroidobacteraceae bacterium]
MASNIAATGLSALILSAAFLLPAAAQAEGDPERGRKLAYTCMGCHGIENHKNAYPNYSVPRLGGQHAAYMMAALAEYESKARWHPTMRGLAATLSDQDKADIAAYFEGPAPVTSGGTPVGTMPAAGQACMACHGADGVGILPEYPTLAGQHEDYLRQALRDYRAGKRQNAIMNGFAATLTDADIRQLAAYFARQPGLYTPRLR